MLSLYGTENGVRVARKHIGWYSKGMVDSGEFRDQVNRLDDPEQVRAMVRAFYEPQLERLAA